MFYKQIIMNMETLKFVKKKKKHRKRYKNKNDKMKKYI